MPARAELRLRLTGAAHVGLLLAAALAALAQFQT